MKHPRACLICLGTEPPDDAQGMYHIACLQGLFNTDACPRVELDLLSLPASTEQTIGKMSISGAQRKALMCLSPDGKKLEPADGSTHILKPQNDRFVHVPENEHLSMCIARRVGLMVPPFGLVVLADKSPAYVIRRYDRSDEEPPRKLHQIDFCQLAQKPSSQRASGSAEECARLLRESVAAPAVELRRLFRLFLLAYFIGNGDLHLKNLSLLRGVDGAYRLSPTYDLVCTWLYKDRSMTLSLGSRCRDIPRKLWLDFAEGHALVPRQEAVRILDDMLACGDDVRGLIARSALPEDLRNAYLRLINKRSRALR